VAPFQEIQKMKMNELVTKVAIAKDITWSEAEQQCGPWRRGSLADHQKASAREHEEAARYRAEQSRLEEAAAKVRAVRMRLRAAVDETRLPPLRRLGPN
jgi:hypothetical protein